MSACAGTFPDHISPSAAKSYLSCSLRFYFERVACIRKKTTVALHLGKAVHAALQAFHLARWRGTDDSPETVSAAFLKAFSDLERDEGPVNYKDDKEREKARQDGLRVVAAYLDSPEVPKVPPRAVEVKLTEEIPGLSVPLTGAMDLVEGNLIPVDFKSSAAKPDSSHAVFDHEIQLVSYQLLMEASIGESPPSLDLVFLVKTKTPQVIRVKSPPADEHRKHRVVALLETAVMGIVSDRFHPQPGMQCSWCQYRRECAAWLPERVMERRAA
ncbi:PD-(D/E)XK nuclease family protein [Luteolibacter sp. SL250]|uniref:RecB family exonuclease n=1 Tax=Luteolibacter sp. SL250 TaxID=2995170 RepID=UPI00226D6848|nr:PD-(D/E)XK nuclease family protein [Luteolibacter sp. SL250]WAC21106.1 PD-(D/E)XK nuclease family protein [Luteolibacter sp. SL250]